MRGPEREPPNLEPRLELARELAEGAGAMLLERLGHVRGVRKKGAVDLLTEADEAAETYLRSRIEALFPDDGVLGEETGGSLGGRGWVWVLDPLDGTTNFVHGLPHFAVSVGLAWRGEPVAGAICAPARGETYHGGGGVGAWAGAERLRVSDTRALEDALLATGFPYDRRATAPALLRPVQRALEQAQGVRRNGAASLDFVDVARGRFDGYWEPRLAAWDMAAGVAIVRAAGGTVTAYGGRPFVLGTPQPQASVVCSNGVLHDALVALVADDGA